MELFNFRQRCTHQTHFSAQNLRCSNIYSSGNCHEGKMLFRSTSPSAAETRERMRWKQDSGTGVFKVFFANKSFLKTFPDAEWENRVLNGRRKIRSRKSPKSASWRMLAFIMWPCRLSLSAHWMVHSSETRRKLIEIIFLGRYRRLTENGENHVSHRRQDEW